MRCLHRYVDARNQVFRNLLKRCEIARELVDRRPTPPAEIRGLFQFFFGVLVSSSISIAAPFTWGIGCRHTSSSYDYRLRRCGAMTGVNFHRTDAHQPEQSHVTVE
jgi:hypothetical protein